MNVLVDQFGRNMEVGDIREITEDGEMEGAVDTVPGRRGVARHGLR